MFSSNLMSEKFDGVAPGNSAMTNDKYDESRAASSSAATNEPIINIYATNTMMEKPAVKEES